MSGSYASKRWDEHLAEVGGWRADVLDTGGVPVWSFNGGTCSGEVYKSVVKLTFFKGASLEDPAGLFTSRLDGKVRRAVDITQGQQVDDAALADLVRAAVEVNTA
jgi:hypothetical protein